MCSNKIYFFSPLAFHW